MAKTGEYKAVDQRGWREQMFPLHPDLIDLETIIATHLNAAGAAMLITVEANLSTIIEASINYAHEQWIKRRAEYTDATHDAGLQLYTTTTVNNDVKVQSQAYLSETTVKKIDELGDHLALTQYHVPRLFARKRESVYNRKLIIVLSMNALALAIKSRDTF